MNNIKMDSKNNTQDNQKKYFQELFSDRFLERSLVSLAIFVVASLISYFFMRLQFPDTNMIVVYMLAILLIVWISNSFIIGIVASVAAVFTFNFFFSEPLYTFSLTDPNYFINFVIMMFAVFVMGTITSRATRSAQEAKRNEERRLAAREETIKERYRANLLRSISHDIRTPLSSIVGSAEMLMDMTDEKDPKRDIAADIVNDAEWLHGMVDNILSLTRIHDENFVIDKEPEAVEEVIGAALGKIDKKLGRRTVETEIPSEVLMVPMDGKLIEQLLLNLLDNSIKHTSDDGKIKIGVEVDANRGLALFSVTDDGTGIKKEDMPHIFEMFYTEGGDNGNSRSMGLGLAICDTIIKAHGGTISADNIEPHGAKFTFTLPINNAHPLV